MITVLWFIRADIYSVFARPILNLAVILACVGALFLIGHMNIEKYEIRIIIQADDELYAQAKGIIEELSYVRAIRIDANSNIWSQLRVHDANVALVHDPALDFKDHVRRWNVILRPTDEVESADLQRLAFSFTHLLQGDLLDFSAVGRLREAQAGAPQSVVDIRTIPLEPGPPNRSPIPRLISLIIVSLSFIIAMRGYMREKTSGMLFAIEAITKHSRIGLKIEQVIFAVFMSLILFVILLAASLVFYDYNVKPGIVVILLYLLAPLAVSSMSGLCVAMISSTSNLAYFLGSLYLLSMMLFSGIFYSLGEADVIVRVISYVFPLTFTIHPLTEWMTFGGQWDLIQWEILPGVVQLLCFFCFVTLIAAGEKFSR